MCQDSYQKIVTLAREKNARENSITYIAEHLGSFLKKGDQVLICFREYEEGNISYLFEQAVLRCGAQPILLGEDKRWKTILRTAFSQRVSTIIGPPLVILGLTKLKKANATPLFIRNVVTAGYPCMDWVVDGITQGFDCATWGCFGDAESSVVAGFSCGHSRGVHLRESEYALDILDENGQPVSDGEIGDIVLYPKAHPELRYYVGDRGRIETAPCACGNRAPRLMDLSPGAKYDSDLSLLGQNLYSWTSVLDAEIKKGEYGLEMEIVVFQGEKLPKLPSAAKQRIRPWEPETDEPFWSVPVTKIPGKKAESH